MCFSGGSSGGGGGVGSGAVPRNTQVFARLVGLVPGIGGQAMRAAILRGGQAATQFAALARGDAKGLTGGVRTLLGGVGKNPLADPTNGKIVGSQWSE